MFCESPRNCPAAARPRADPFAPDIAPPFGDKHRGRISNGRKRYLSARSARTRWIGRGRRPHTVHGGVERHIGRSRYLSDKYRAVLVKHATSPSRRNGSRQAVYSRLSKVSRVRTKSFSRYQSIQPVQTTRPFRAGLRSDCRAPHFSFSSERDAKEISFEKFRHSTAVAHVTMGRHPTSLGKHRQRAYRRRFARPPRIQNRAGLKIVGAASRLEIRPCVARRNQLDDALRCPNPFQHAQRHHDSCETGKQVFESAHKIARVQCVVINCNAAQKIFHKFFKREPSNRIFETLHLAMGISD